MNNFQLQFILNLQPFISQMLTLELFLAQILALKLVFVLQPLLIPALAMALLFILDSLYFVLTELQDSSEKLLVHQFQVLKSSPNSEVLYLLLFSLSSNLLLFQGFVEKLLEQKPSVEFSSLDFTQLKL